MSPRKQACPDCGKLRLHLAWCERSRERRWFNALAAELIEQLREPGRVPEQHRGSVAQANDFRRRYALAWLCERLPPELREQLTDAVTRY